MQAGDRKEPACLWLSAARLVPAIVRACAWTVIVYMLLSDADAGYIAAAGAALADIAWAGAGYGFGYLNTLFAALNASMAAIICLAAVASPVQARLGRSDLALRSFGWGAEAALGDPEVARLIEWARSRAGNG